MVYNSSIYKTSLKGFDRNPSVCTQYSQISAVFLKTRRTQHCFYSTTFAFYEEDRLVGLVVKASAPRAEDLVFESDPVFESRFRWDIFGSSHLILFYLSRSLADRWGTTVDFTTSFLHSSRFSAFRSMIYHLRPVQSLILSSHLFLCLPLRLPPWTVPCRIVLASPDDRVTCPYHVSLRLFTEVRPSNDQMAFPVLAFTSSLILWSLYEIPRSLRKHLIFNACILLSVSAVMVHVSHA